MKSRRKRVLEFEGINFPIEVDFSFIGLTDDTNSNTAEPVN